MNRNKNKMRINLKINIKIKIRINFKNKIIKKNKIKMKIIIEKKLSINNKWTIFSELKKCKCTYFPTINNFIYIESLQPLLIKNKKKLMA